MSINGDSINIDYFLCFKKNVLCFVKKRKSFIFCALFEALHIHFI